MSYDFCVVIHTGKRFSGVSGCSKNYTSNVSEMWYTANPKLGRLFDEAADLECGVPMDQVKREAARAWCEMVKNRAKYEAMNPLNGWGNYSGARKVLWELIHWGNQHPAARLRIWR